MRIILSILLLLPALTQAASIKEKSSITCISDQSSLQGRHKDFVAGKNSEKAKSWFSEWMMAENFGNMKSKIYFTWQPKTPNGPSIQIETTDKPHNLIRIRSQTRDSLIVVSSASSPFSTESWTFIFNFAVETMIATRVQSNVGGLKGEVITYDCHFDSLELDTLGTLEAASPAVPAGFDGEIRDSGSNHIELGVNGNETVAFSTMHYHLAATVDFAGEDR